MFSINFFKFLFKRKKKLEIKIHTYFTFTTVIKLAQYL